MYGGWIQIKRGSETIGDWEVTEAVRDHWFKKKRYWVEMVEMEGVGKVLIKQKKSWILNDNQK